MNYNAVAVSLALTGEPMTITAVQYEDGLILRAAGHWTPNAGSPAFHADWVRGRPSFTVRTQVRVCEPHAAMIAWLSRKPLPGKVVDEIDHARAVSPAKEVA